MPRQAGFPGLVTISRYPHRSVPSSWNWSDGRACCDCAFHTTSFCHVARFSLAVLDLFGSLCAECRFSGFRSIGFILARAGGEGAEVCTRKKADRAASTGCRLGDPAGTLLVLV